MTTRDNPQIEAAARVIYEVMRKAAGMGNCYPWQDGGNGTRQDDARRAAVEVLALTTPPDEIAPRGMTREDVLREFGVSVNEFGIYGSPSPGECVKALADEIARLRGDAKRPVTGASFHTEHSRKVENEVRAEVERMCGVSPLPDLGWTVHIVRNSALVLNHQALYPNPPFQPDRRIEELRKAWESEEPCIVATDASGNLMVLASKRLVWPKETNAPLDAAMREGRDA